MNRFSRWLHAIDVNGALGHWLVIGICAGALGLAAFLEVPSPNSPSVAVESHKIPSICGFKNLTGIDCPGCGLTRSWVAGMHGRISDSLRFHRLGWLLMLFAFLQIVRHGVWLARPAARKAVGIWGRRLDGTLMPIVILLLINWIVGFFLPQL